MKKNENIPEEELRISDQDHTMDSENEIARKTRIKHRRGQDQYGEPQNPRPLI